MPRQLIFGPVFTCIFFAASLVSNGGMRQLQHFPSKVRRDMLPTQVAFIAASGVRPSLAVTRAGGVRARGAIVSLGLASLSRAARRNRILALGRPRQLQRDPPHASPAAPKSCRRAARAAACAATAGRLRGPLHTPAQQRGGSIRGG